MDQAWIFKYKLCRNESISLFPPIFMKLRQSFVYKLYKLSTEGIDKPRINKWKIVAGLCHLSFCLLAYLCTQCYQFTFLYRFEMSYSFNSFARCSRGASVLQKPGGWGESSQKETGGVIDFFLDNPIHSKGPFLLSPYFTWTNLHSLIRNTENLKDGLPVSANK